MKCMNKRQRSNGVVIIFKRGRNGWICKGNAALRERPDGKERKRKSERRRKRGGGK